ELWADGTEDQSTVPINERYTYHVLDGDCDQDIDDHDSRSIIHILGDLKARIRVGDFSEVIVGGSVLPGGSIESSGIAHLFINHNMDGTLLWRSYFPCIIEGHLRGRLILNGNWSDIHVRGDITGTIEPEN